MSSCSWKNLFGGLVVAVALAAQPGQAATYDLQSAFSDTNNPNGPWTYFAGTTALPALAGDWGGYGLGPGFGQSLAFGVGFTPVIFRYNGSDPTGIDGASGDIIAHTQTNDPNAGAGDFSVRFVSPTAGLADISGRIWDAHKLVDRNQAWQVLVNGVSQVSGVVLGNGTEGSANPDTFSLLSILLQAGDTVVLKAVLSGGAAQTNGGLVGFNMNIDIQETSPVPLPAALPLLATGLGTLSFIGFRRRRKSAAA